MRTSARFAGIVLRPIDAVIGSVRLAPEPGRLPRLYILPLTAHSNVLQEFGGGDGKVGFHDCGGASLSDPLGTARSHGCIRLFNRAIGWLVPKIGANRPPGTPVRIS